MHGRLKVRTTAEENARKKKEQALKVIKYQNGMSNIFEKRQNNELDDDMLTKTAQILIKNPDVTTLWNIRKECILNLITISDENELLFNKDLKFIEQCLLVNPKSYSAWHHRCWILENCKNPDWENEVKLCTTYLKADERNFHCWDYRRYVTEKAKLSKESELEFCTEKIEKNFSNYSSWHYRSKLLPIVFPTNDSRTSLIETSKLKEELELALTAAFTDPDDSSSWFYQRWLLSFPEPELSLCAVRITKNFAIISFTKYVNAKKFNISSNVTDLMKSVWEPIRPNNILDKIWIAKGEYNLNESCDKSYLHCITDTHGKFEMDLNKSNDYYIGINCPPFEYEFQPIMLTALEEQLGACETLLKFEPDSKWTLLTAALLMRAINRKLYHKKSIDNLMKLCKIDNLRIGYYSDLSSKWQIQDKLDNWIKNINNTNSIDLSGLNLTRILYEEMLVMAENIDLSNNKLTNRSLRKLCALQFINNINIQGNLLTDEYSGLKSLENLILHD